MSGELLLLPPPPPAHDLVLRPHPFSQDYGVFPVRAGQTLQAMLEEAAQGGVLSSTLRVEVGGYDVPRAMWARVRPKPGTAIHVTHMPAGSGGGKKWLRTILMVAVMAFAWYAGGVVAGWAGYGATAGMVTTTAITMVGNLIVNALVPPPVPGVNGGGDASRQGQLHQLTGSQNALAPYGPIPLIIGQSKFFPTHAAMPYSESVGQTSYQRLMFDLGHGDLDVTDEKIGESPLSAYEEVQYEVTTTPTLYTSDVNEVAVNAAMNDGDSVIRTTMANVDEISADLVFQQGLFGVDKKGNIVKAIASVTIQYRAVGSGTWLAAPIMTGLPTAGIMPRSRNLHQMVVNAAQITRGDREPFVASVAWGVPLGQYEVRMTRGATNWGTSEGNSRFGDAVWSVLRSIRHTNPSTTGTKKLCMRIKASEQLQGVLQTFSCVGAQKIKVYNPGTGTWSPPQVNFNPAWVVAWLLTECKAVWGDETPLSTSRLDLTSFADYAAFCTQHDFESRGMLDVSMPLRELIDDILSCSLGALTYRDGKYAILFDSGTATSTMSFTPLDSTNFRGTRNFVRLPHALRVRFRNPSANWEQDEIVVPADGYSFKGKDARGNASAAPAATEFETIDLRMAADAHQAWRVARHHFAQAIFRNTIYTWDTDVANLTVTRGDLVDVAHDVTDWGTGWGRVQSLSGTTLVLDERIELQSATSYSVHLRKRDGSSVVVALTGVVAGETNTFTLASAPAGVNLGDAAVIGETGSETVQLLITGIRAKADLSATITAVNYSPAVAAYWANPPAVIVSEISGTAFTDPPPAPNIFVVLSAQANDTPNDGGTTAPSVRIGVRPTPGYRLPSGGGSYSSNRFGRTHLV